MLNFLSELVVTIFAFVVSFPILLLVLYWIISMISIFSPKVQRFSCLFMTIARYPHLFTDDMKRPVDVTFSWCWETTKINYDQLNNQIKHLRDGDAVSLSFPHRLSFDINKKRHIKNIKIYGVH